jgi:uncharacterized protein (TIRG00374 family)
MNEVSTPSPLSPPWLRNLGRGVRWLVGLGILGYLILVIRPQELWAHLRNFDLLWIPVWIATYLVAQLLGAAKMFVLLRAFGRVPYLTVVRYDMVATSIGYFTPGSIGAPISLTLNLRKESIGMAQSAAAFMVDKVLTLVVVVCFGCIGIWFAFSGEALHPAVGQLFVYAAYVLFAAALVGTGIVVARHISILQRLYDIAARVWKAMSIYRDHKSSLALNLGITVVMQCVWALLWLIVFHGLGMQVQFLGLLTTVPAVSFVGYLPVSVGGLGTQEVTAIALWAHAGILAESALSAFLVSRILTLITAVALIIVGVKVWKSKSGS